MTIEFFRAAANGQVATVQSLLADPTGNININFRGPGGMTSLHAATKFRHVEVVRVLLAHGARKDIKDNLGHTTMSFTEEFLTREIFDLLRPELALARLEREQIVQAEINQYTQNHVFAIDKQTLVELGTHYLQQESLIANLNRDNVIQYITSAIEHMTLDLLKAKKIADADSDELWNTNYKASQMLYAISACAFYIRETHSDIAGKLPNIAWEPLALYIRHSQFNPNFLSALNPKTIMELVYNTLHSMLASGELETMRNNVESLQSTSALPTIHALMGFLSDEYNAQYIENGIKNYRDHGNLTSEVGRARLLINFIEIGEALENASPRLQSLFHTKAIEHLSIIRNAIAHPERTGNREMINDFLNGKSNSVTISGIAIDLQALAAYCIGQYDTVSKFLQQYDRPDQFAKPDDLWQDIIDHVNDYAISSKLKIPRSSNETELGKISQAHRDKIGQLDQSYEDRTEALDNAIIEWFNNKKFPDKIAVKLKDSLGSFRETEEALNTYKGEYDSSKAKSEGDRTKTDKKLIKDYENVIIKHEQWQRYCKELSDITQDINTQKQQAEQCKISDISKFAIKLIDDFLSYSTQVQTLFAQLNNFQHVIHTSTGDTSRGFPGHQDHPVLAFYQIIVGSLSRTLISIDNVNKIIPPELHHTLENIVIAARGYLAHIGVREAGESFSESIDRAAVFYTNSKKIVESIESMKIIKYAVENGLGNFSEAMATRDADISIVALVNSYLLSNDNPAFLQQDSHISSTTLIPDHSTTVMVGEPAIAPNSDL
jgi:hypothetical protein